MNVKFTGLVLCLFLAACAAEPEGLSEHRQEVDTLVAEIAFHDENLGEAISSLELITEEISETADTTAEELAYYKALQKKKAEDVETNFHKLSELLPRITTATALMTKREDFLPYYEDGGKYRGHAVRLGESASISSESAERAAVAVHRSTEAIDALDMRSTSKALALLEELEQSGKIAAALEAHGPYMEQLAITERAYIAYKETPVRYNATRRSHWEMQEGKRAELAKLWIDARKDVLEKELGVAVALAGPTMSDSLYGVSVDTDAIYERLNHLTASLDKAAEEADEAWERYDAL